MCVLTVEIQCNPVYERNKIKGKLENERGERNAAGIKFDPCPGQAGFCVNVLRSVHVFNTRFEAKARISAGLHGAATRHKAQVAFAMHSSLLPFANNLRSSIPFRTLFFPSTFHNFQNPTSPTPTIIMFPQQQLMCQQAAVYFIYTNILIYCLYYMKYFFTYDNLFIFYTNQNAH